jgi:putative Mg2+ transporter-C (MgtC) family protein
LITFKRKVNIRRPYKEGVWMDIWHLSNMELVIRVMLAVICGGLIGFEREWSHQAAGLRTHILVSMGSTTIMLLSIYGFSGFVKEAHLNIDPTRLAAQVISGIGFLGAGAIIRNGSTVKGLTTAASIWTVAAIGLSIGAGFYRVALSATLGVLIVLFVLYKGEQLLFFRVRSHNLMIQTTGKGIPHPIIRALEVHKIKVVGVHFKQMNKVQAESIFEWQIRVKIKHQDQLV